MILIVQEGLNANGTAAPADTPLQDSFSISRRNYMHKEPAATGQTRAKRDKRAKMECVN
jgi:hypothetical protein